MSILHEEAKYITARVLWGMHTTVTGTNFAAPWFQFCYLFQKTASYLLLIVAAYTTISIWFLVYCENRPHNVVVKQTLFNYEAYRDIGCMARSHDYSVCIRNHRCFRAFAHCRARHLAIAPTYAQVLCHCYTVYVILRSAVLRLVSRKAFYGQSYSFKKYITQ